MKSYFFLIGCLCLVMGSCGATQEANDESISLKEELTKKNRQNITLLDQIRQIPGVALRGGVPAFSKVSGTLSGGASSQEPLYVLDNYVVGNSFNSLSELVRNIDIDKIETFTGPDASYYGSRGANGVIKITTIK